MVQLSDFYGVVAEQPDNSNSMGVDTGGRPTGQVAMLIAESFKPPQRFSSMD
jgi:hypothetical protein